MATRTKESDLRIVEEEGGEGEEEREADDEKEASMTGLGAPLITFQVVQLQACTASRARACLMSELPLPDAAWANRRARELPWPLCKRLVVVKTSDAGMLEDDISRLAFSCFDLPGAR